MWNAELRGHVAVLTYTRPPQNLLGFADLAELDQVLEHWAGDERARLIVLTGGLAGYFAAHADLADVAALVHGAATGPHGPDAWPRALARISAIPQPVIAAINGQAWGGGLELALSCLMRAASPAAHFRFPEVAGGAIPGAGGTQRLPRLIGLSRAARLILSGEVVAAPEALRLGLIDVILPGEKFLNAVLDWAAPLAAQPRHSLAAAKQALLLTAQLPLDHGITREQDIFRTTLASPRTQAMHAHTRLPPRPLPAGSTGGGLVYVARHPVEQADGAVQVSGRGRRRAGWQASQEAVEAGRQRPRQLGADHGGVPNGLRVDAPDDLEAPGGLGSVLLAQEFPGGQEGGMIRTRADQEPFPAQRRVRRQADGQRRGAGPGRLAEVREHDDGAGRASQLLPPVFGITVEPLLLESGEQRWLFGPRAAFVLDGLGQGQ
jgi:enoyl-CoA hydratase/carnithine racemase